MNLLQTIFLALLGLSAGMIVAGGVFSFIVELGVISDFADRTWSRRVWICNSSACNNGMCYDARLQPGYLSGWCCNSESGA